MLTRETTKEHQVTQRFLKSGSSIVSSSFDNPAVNTSNPVETLSLPVAEEDVAAYDDVVLQQLLRRVGSTVKYVR